MYKNLRCGVIGLGGISATHTGAYLQCPRAELYAICDSSPSWLAFAQKKFNTPKAYVDYRELLADPDIDAVSICLPTGLHAEVTVAALNAGKHVLCEKPMAINADEARQMRDAAVRNDKKLMISQNQRFDQNVQLMKRRVDEGFFGDLYFVRIAWRRPTGMMPGPDAVRENGEHYSRNWFNEKDNGGGVLRDLGCHLLDLTMYIADFPKLISADARCYRKFFPDGYKPGAFVCDSEDLATAHIKFENGLTVQLEVSFGSHVESEVVVTDLYGTKGGASRFGGDGTLTFFRDDDAGNAIAESVTRYAQPYIGTQSRFVDSVLDDLPVPIPAEEGIQVIEALDAIYQSAAVIL